MHTNATLTAGALYRDVVALRPVHARACLCGSWFVAFGVAPLARRVSRVANASPPFSGGLPFPSEALSGAKWDSIPSRPERKKRALRNVQLLRRKHSRAPPYAMLVNA